MRTTPNAVAQNRNTTEAAEAIAGASDDAPPGPPDAAAATRAYLNNRKLSIYGGSNEIQRGIIAKSLLGL